MQTLPDYLSERLSIISVGLNPSLPSVQAGFYFANPRNRFWQALNRSDLIENELTPSIEAMHILHDRYGMGFTDLVKRPTADSSSLRANDYRQAAPQLKQKLINSQARLIWFHGKLAYGKYLFYAEGVRNKELLWGEQALRIGDSRVYVSPNPSPANAVYSLEDLIDWFNKVKHFVDSIKA